MSTETGRARPTSHPITFTEEVPTMALDIPADLAPALGSRYPHRPRVLYLLRRRPEVGAEALEQALTRWRAERPSGVVAGSLLARAGIATDERQEDISGRFLAAGPDVEFTAYDGYVSLDLESFAPIADDFESLLAAAKGVLDSLDDVVDRSASVALAGVVNLVIGGHGPLAMVLQLDRAPHLSVEQFNEWWMRHGDDHRRWFLGQVGYHQLHIAPELNVRAAEAAGTATTDLCVTDIMYLGDLDDAFASTIDRSSEDAKVLSADIAANTSMARSGGTFFREV